MPRSQKNPGRGIQIAAELKGADLDEQKDLEALERSFRKQLVDDRITYRDWLENEIRWYLSGRRPLRRYREVLRADK